MIGVNVSQPSTYSAVPMAATGYVPGLGRGAVGFTTRSDIGPARPAAPDPRAAFGLGRGAGGGGPPLLGGAAPAGYVVGMGRGGISGGIMSKGPAPPGAPAGAPGERETKDYSETNYDEFSGYGEKLFSDVPYDADDREADAIYEAIDERMDRCIRVCARTCVCWARVCEWRRARLLAAGASGSARRPRRSSRRSCAWRSRQSRTSSRT